MKVLLNNNDELGKNVDADFCVISCLVALGIDEQISRTAKLVLFKNLHQKNR